MYRETDPPLFSRPTMPEDPPLNLDRFLNEIVPTAVMTLFMAAMLIFIGFIIGQGSVAAQVVDTVTVEVYGEPDAIVVDGPIRAYVGDEVTFAYEVVDSAGNPTIGVVTWEVEDPTRATILSETDSTLVVRIDRPGRLTLIATANRLTSLSLGGLYGPGTGSREGEFQWASQGRFQVVCSNGPPCEPVPTIYMCVVGFAGSRAIFATGACADQMATTSPVRDGLIQLVRVERSDFYIPGRLVAS